MTCETCHGPVTLERRPLTGQVIEHCSGCGSGPLRPRVAPVFAPVTVTDIPPLMVPAVCAICHKDFLTRSARPAKACSPRCRETERLNRLRPNRERRSRYVAVPMLDYVCEDCGAAGQTRRGRPRKVCGPCYTKREAKRKWQLELQRRATHVA